jgi:hypothetical protein
MNCAWRLSAELLRLLRLFFLFFLLSLFFLESESDPLSELELGLGSVLRFPRVGIGALSLPRSLLTDRELDLPPLALVDRLLPRGGLGSRPLDLDPERDLLALLLLDFDFSGDLDLRRLDLDLDLDLLGLRSLELDLLIGFGLLERLLS